MIMTISKWSTLFLLSNPITTTLSFVTPQIKQPFHTTRHPTHLSSLNKLIDNLTSPSPTTRILFVGGKGGVGKTSISSSIAVHLSSLPSPPKVLIVSTDPAHSLGDALDESLGETPTPLTDALTQGNLYACEIDPMAALEEFRENLSSFDIDRLAGSLGVSTQFLEGLGLREFGGLLKNPPPGLDELVALGNILDPSSGIRAGQDFDLIVVDTAPTGHTLRLLSLPKFLDGFLGKLLELRLKLSGIASTLQSFLGSEEAQSRAATLDTAISKLESFRTKMSFLRKTLMDAQKTNFLVVTIPTKLSWAESQRLVGELGKEGVAVTDMVVNQCVSVGDISNMDAYYDRRTSEQHRWIEELQSTLNEISSTKEYRSNSGERPIHVKQVPYFDTELVGVPALSYLGKSCLKDDDELKYLMDDSDDKTKFIICGGKGGVGKTTTSSALAIAMAESGHNVALISTDPAHSLGDALDLNLSNGDFIDIPLAQGGSLSAMEVNPAQSLNQFKTLVDSLIPGEGGEVAETVRDLGQIFDTLPAGTDEVVALAKVVNLLKKGGYTRIVLDTAPTGHTLRMLTTPSFLAELIDRVLVIADRVNSNSMVKMLITSSVGNTETMSTAASQAKSTLLNFQMQMYDLEDLFANPNQTEFLVVCIPTELAVRESIRLVNDLTFEAPDMPVSVKNVVVNQILEVGGIDGFIERVERSQDLIVGVLEKALGGEMEITKVPYLDTEPRGVFGLRVLANELVD